MGQDANGGAGTIYLKSSTQQYGDLVVDNGSIVTTGYSTPLAFIGTGTSTSLTASIQAAQKTGEQNNLIGF